MYASGHEQLKRKTYNFLRYSDRRLFTGFTRSALMRLNEPTISFTGIISRFPAFFAQFY